MRVLIISAAIPPMRAGEADHVFHLSQHLSERGMDVHVLTTKTSIAQNNVAFKVYPLIRNWSWLDLPRLAMFLMRCSPDVVLLIYSGWIYNDHPMITFAPTLSKRLIPRVPFVTQFDISERSYRKSILTRVVRKVIKQWVGPEQVDFVFGTLLRDSDRIIVLSEQHLAGFSELIKGKSIVIPPPPLMRICPNDNGIARQSGRATLDLKPNDFLLAYFGYVEANKGVDTLLKSFQILTNRRCNVRLIMVGGAEGYSKAGSDKRSKEIAKYGQAMHELSKELGIADKMIWTRGYACDSDEASIYLYAADACVLPYDKGITLSKSSFAAAAAHGLPIISTKGEILEAPFVDQKNVFLCPPKDPEALAEAIDLLISNAELQQRLHIGALELVQEWFSWDKAIWRTIGTWKSLEV